MKFVEVPLYAIIGEALLLASIQFAIGSVEQSSRFSVASFANNQDTLDRANDALRSYVFISLVWTLGSCLVLFGKYKWTGAICAFLANFFIILWIVLSYQNMFHIVSVKNNLIEPSLFG